MRPWTDEAQTELRIANDPALESDWTGRRRVAGRRKYEGMTDSWGFSHRY